MVKKRRLKPRSPPPSELNSANEVIDALGGTGAVADWLGVDIRVVSNWRVRGLPPETYKAFNTRLDSLGGWTAPSSLWRQKEPVKS